MTSIRWAVLTIIISVLLSVGIILPLVSSGKVPIHTTNVTPTTVPTVTPTLLTCCPPRTKTIGCHVQGALPDRECTPGAVINGITVSQVCTSGYSSSVRNVEQGEKDQVYASYGVVSRKSGEYEIDHLVPLELGGSNDIANLWPEAAEPRPGFHEKDTIENKLHEAVCRGEIGFGRTQIMIAENWLLLGR